MPSLTDRAFALAASLQARHLELKSWRRIAEVDYGDKIHFSVLNKIANTGGKYLPKDRESLITLGLVEAPKRREILPGERRVQRIIGRMARETEKDVMRKP
jgi:hypothetical protein